MVTGFMTAKSGDRKFTALQVADAEKADEAADMLGADPNVSKDLTIKALQEPNRRMQELRTRLDKLRLHTQ
jgi:hypothetical protein